MWASNQLSLKRGKKNDYCQEGALIPKSNTEIEQQKEFYDKGICEDTVELQELGNGVRLEDLLNWMGVSLCAEECLESLKILQFLGH